jgi:Xaa-Pro aminopeptidase
VPGEKLLYSSWTEQVECLRRMTAGLKRIAMQYSPLCAIPYVSMVDAGTVELVRSLGLDVVTSAELIQVFEARWTEAQLASHLEAGRRMDRVRSEAFALIRERTRNAAPLTEVEVKDFFRRRYAEEGLVVDHGPIVGVNANSSDQHYEPTEETTSPIRSGDWVLLDMWAKLDRPDAVVYDITWTGYCGDQPTDEMRRVFATVIGARDAAIRCVQQAVEAKRDLRGFEVDDAARGVIAGAGYGEYFVHRTGHSIGVEVHGNGANMDNFENHDERRVIPWTCFSIEPGIYLPHFGVRSEIDMFVGDDDARVTGEMQRELQLL